MLVQRAFDELPEEWAEDLRTALEESGRFHVMVEESSYDRGRRVLVLKRVDDTPSDAAYHVQLWEEIR